MVGLYVFGYDVEYYVGVDEVVECFVVVVDCGVVV